jgi:hypothetical protein
VPDCGRKTAIAEKVKVVLQGYTREKEKGKSVAIVE